MINFQNKSKNIIQLALPPDIKNNSKHSHRPHIADDAVRKWNIGTADVHLRKKSDRKNQMLMTQQFEFYSRKELFSNRFIQSQIKSSQAENSKKEQGKSSSLKKYSIDAGYIFSERQKNSYSKGFPQKTKKNRYYVMKSPNVSKVKNYIRTQQIVKKLTLEKHSTFHDKGQFIGFSQKKNVQDSFNDIFMKKRVPFTLKTEPNDNKNVCSFMEEDFFQPKQQTRISIIDKVRSHKRIHRASIKVCYSKKDCSQNIDPLLNTNES